jgi:Ran GTPase-activating protein (RanGAP) involved in mRNA processing and transport
MLPVMSRTNEHSSRDFPAFSYSKELEKPYRDFYENGAIPQDDYTRSHIARRYIKNNQPCELAEFLIKGHINSLNFDHHSLNEQDAKVLAVVLKENTTLLRLSLRNNQFGAKGLEVICQALEDNATLKVLNLGNNDPQGSDCVQAIGKMIAKNRTLQGLDLTFSNMNAEALRILAKSMEENQALSEMELGYNYFADEGAGVLAEMLKKNTALKTLNLRANLIGPEGGRLIAGGLKENTTLRQLNLNDNHLGSDGAEPVLNALESNATLASLSIASNGLDSASAEHIGSLLRRNNALSSVDLSGNLIFFAPDTAPSEAIDSVVHGLDRNTTVTRLNIAGNHPENQPYFGRSIHILEWSLQQRRDVDRERVENLLQRNRALNALSEKDAHLASRLFPGQQLSLDEGSVLAGALVMAAPSAAAYQATMVEIHCCINMLA